MVRYRIPAAVHARCSSASASAPNVPHSLCGILVPWTGGAAVRVEIHDVRVVREHGGHLRSRMRSARGARAAQAALLRARAAPRDGRPRGGSDACPTGHGIGAQPVCASLCDPGHHQGLCGHLRLKLRTRLSGLLVVGGQGERCSQRTCVLSSVGHDVTLMTCEYVIRLKATLWRESMY